MCIRDSLKRIATLPCDILMSDKLKQPEVYRLKFTAKSASERILKIGYHLAKLEAKNRVVPFFLDMVYTHSTALWPNKKSLLNWLLTHCN